MWGLRKKIDLEVVDRKKCWLEDKHMCELEVLPQEPKPKLPVSVN